MALFVGLGALSVFTQNRFLGEGIKGSSSGIGASEKNTKTGAPPP